MTIGRITGPVIGQIKEAARHTPCASLLLSVSAVLIYLVPSLGEGLQFDRAAIDTGDWWRLLTCHWTHWSLDHLFWDTLVFVVLGAACERSSRTRFLACVAGSAMACSLAVWLFLPQVEVYRGLSGIDSALFALVGVSLLRVAATEGRWGTLVAAGTLVIAFVGKTSFEVMAGTTIFVDSAATGTVSVPLAHVVGAVLGGYLATERLFDRTPTCDSYMCPVHRSIPRGGTS